jgi:hypothetical protein
MRKIIDFVPSLDYQQKNSICVNEATFEAYH